MSLSFLNPAYLGALALGAIPILIHLIRKRRIKIIPWAAWEFLRQSRRKNRRRLRLEQLLLLLLRILIVCLVVMALCRPVMRTIGLPLIAADSHVHALIALDNSFSMGYRRAGITDFERARRIADSLFARLLKQGDSVSVALTSSRPEALLKEPTFDLSRAREAVRTARLSDRDTDYGAAAAFCADLLRKVRTPVKEVYWITDSQRTGFPESGAERTRAAWNDLAKTARVTWIDLSAPGRDNLSVEPPTLSRGLVTPRTPVRIETVVRNHGGAAKTGLLVDLNVDGRPVGAAKVDVPAHGQAKAHLVYVFEKAGIHTGSVHLSQSDSLARDDTAFFAADVRDRLKVLIVDSHPSGDPAKDEAFYLATALNPAGASTGSAMAIQPVIHSGPNLSGINLRDYDAVIVTGLEALDSAGARALEEYVGNGGGLLVFPGRDAGPARINGVLTALTATADGRRQRAGTLNPPAVRYGQRHQLPPESALSLNPATITHPALARFRDTSEINLGSARFTLMYDLAAAEDESTRILCRFTGGQPAFVERKTGQGRVIVAAITSGAGGTDLPFRAAYVPMIHQIASYLSAGRASQRMIHVGQPISARFDVRESGKPIRLTDPSGAASAQKSALTAQGVVFSYPNTSQAGIYRVSPAGSAASEAIAVNLPEGESDLASLNEPQIRAAVGTIPVQFAQGTEGLESAVRRSRRGSETWRGLILGALLLLFMESLLAQRFGRRG